MSSELPTLDGTAALVTGGTSGIGAAIARALLRAGTPVALTGRDGEGAARAAQELLDETGTECVGLALDVTEDASCAAMVAALEGFRPIEGLVNNAGFAETMGSISSGNLDLARRLMEVNFFGPMRLFGALAPGMLERGSGRVVQVASSSSLLSAEVSSPPRRGFSAMAQIHTLTDIKT